MLLFHSMANRSFDFLKDIILVLKTEKTTVKQETYCKGMCPLVFHDIKNVIDHHTWTWPQDDAKAHRARASIHLLQQSSPDSLHQKIGSQKAQN